MFELRELCAVCFETEVRCLLLLWEMLVCAVLLSGKLQKATLVPLLLIQINTINNDLWVAVKTEIQF